MTFIYVCTSAHIFTYHIPRENGRQAGKFLRKTDIQTLGSALVWGTPGLFEVMPTGNHLLFRPSETHKTRAS